MSLDQSVCTFKFSCLDVLLSVHGKLQFLSLKLRSNYKERTSLSLRPSNVSILSVSLVAKVAVILGNNPGTTL